MTRERTTSGARRWAMLVSATMPSESANPFRNNMASSMANQGASPAAIDEALTTRVPKTRMGPSCGRFMNRPTPDPVTEPRPHDATSAP